MRGNEAWRTKIRLNFKHKEVSISFITEICIYILARNYKLNDIDREVPSLRVVVLLLHLQQNGNLQKINNSLVAI